MKKEIKDLIKNPLVKKHKIAERVEENGLYECSSCGDLVVVMGGERLPAMCVMENIF